MTKRIAITNGRVFTAAGAGVLEGADLLITDDRITAVGPAGTVDIPAGATTIDASGKFVMPGLIDSHVHVHMSGGQASLFGFLGTGVTTVRDLGGDPDVTLPMRDEIERGERVGPRMVVYGPFVEGEPPVFGAMAATRQPPQSPAAAPARGGPAALVGGMWVHTTVDEIRRTVDSLLERRVDGVKAYAGLRPELVEAVVKAVDGRIPVAAHLGRTWASEAIPMGVKTLEHVHASLYQDVVRPDDRHGREDGNGGRANYWTWLSEGWSRADLDAPHVSAFIESIVRNGVVVSPTAVLVTNGMATTEARDEPGLRYLSKEQQERRRMREEMQRAAQAQGRALPRVDPAIGERALDNELELLRRIHEAGGVVVPSTDVGPTPAPGFALHRELSLHVRAGIPAADVLQNATKVAANLLGKPDLGTLEPGKLADVLVIDGDPLADISATRRVRTVIKAGVVYEPEAILNQILEV